MRVSTTPVRIPTRTDPAATANAATRRAQARNELSTGPFGADYWSEIEKLSGRAATKATHIEMLREPDAAWEQRIQLIRASKTAVWGSFYIVDADRRGFQLFEELIAARRRGVDVCLTIDSIAHLAKSLGDPRADRKKLSDLIATLQAEGGVVTWAGTIDDQLRNPGAGVHFKSLVSDNRVAVVGGRNISNEYFGDWSDFDTRLEGPVVQQLGRATLELLRNSDATPVPFQRDAARDAQAIQVQDRIQALLDKPAPTGGSQPNRPPVEFRLVTFDPLVDGAGGKQNAVSEALVATIERAQSEIVLTSNFVMPSFELREALMDAARRGVKVKLVTSGAEAVNPILHKAAALTYSDLLAAGCEIWETRSHEHGKMYVVDGKVGAYGSYNASMVSDQLNADGLLFTSDKRVVSELQRSIGETLATSERYTGEPNRFVAWIFGVAGRLFGDDRSKEPA